MQIGEQFPNAFTLVVSNTQTTKQIAANAQRKRIVIKCIKHSCIFAIQFAKKLEAGEVSTANSFYSGANTADETALQGMTIFEDRETFDHKCFKGAINFYWLLTDASSMFFIYEE
jgi:hypothetical protein